MESPAQDPQAAHSHCVAARLSEKPGAQDQSANANEKAADGGSSENPTEADERGQAEALQERERTSSDGQLGAKCKALNEKIGSGRKDESERNSHGDAQVKHAASSKSNSHLADRGYAAQATSSQPRGSSQGQKISPGQDQGAVGVGGMSERAEEERQDEDANEGLDLSLQGIDMKEQKRIMHEIWVRNNLRQADRSPKKQARKQSHSTTSNVTKQPRLTDRFFKRA